MKNKKVKVDKIGSVLKNMGLCNKVCVSENANLLEGDVLVVQALEEQEKYGDLELINGTLSKINKGDLIIGVLGERKALTGIVGIVPIKVKDDDVLHILNIGGVIGKAVSWNKDFVKSPIPVKVIGNVIVKGKKLNIHDCIQKLDSTLKKTSPLIVVMGTAMNVGKTTATTYIISALTKKLKLNVAAAKLTGVAAQKDIFAMKKAGAKEVVSFLDVGISSTINHHGLVVPAAKTLLNKLSSKKPDVIVVELGDGIIGWYGVDKLLNNSELANAIHFKIMCTHDLVGAKGAYDMLKELNLTIDYFAGPVTNNTAGTDYLENNLNVPSGDLRYDTSKLLKIIKTKGVIKYD